MHDPMRVAFEIKWPWYWMKYRPNLVTIWHVDPERDGSDNSCGWFMRPGHGNKETLEKIVKAFEFDWDRVFVSDSKRSYLCGLFAPNGEPHFSVHGIALNLFFIAAGVVFNSNGHTMWRKARRFVNKHLVEILLFAENTTDSLYDGITRKFEVGCGEKYTKESRDARIRQMAGCIYAWILRANRPWYRHPRWHVHHWKIQVHPLQSFKRWAFSRCAECGKGFRWGESPVSFGWGGTGPLWFRSEKHIHHSNCAGSAMVKKDESRV